MFACLCLRMLGYATFSVYSVYVLCSVSCMLSCFRTLACLSVISVFWTVHGLAMGVQTKLAYYAVPSAKRVNLFIDLDTDDTAADLTSHMVQHCWHCWPRKIAIKKI